MRSLPTRIRVAIPCMLLEGTVGECRASSVNAARMDGGKRGPSPCAPAGARLPVCRSSTVPICHTGNPAFAHCSTTGAVRWKLGWVGSNALWRETRSTAKTPSSCPTRMGTSKPVCQKMRVSNNHRWYCRRHGWCVLHTSPWSSSACLTNTLSEDAKDLRPRGLRYRTE